MMRRNVPLWSDELFPVKDDVLHRGPRPFQPMNECQLLARSHMRSVLDIWRFANDPSKRWNPPHTFYDMEDRLTEWWRHQIRHRIEHTLWIAAWRAKTDEEKRAVLMRKQERMNGYQISRWGINELERLKTADMSVWVNPPTRYLFGPPEMYDGPDIWGDNEVLHGRKLPIKWKKGKRI